MKSLLIALLTIFFVSTPALSQSNQAVFDEANIFLENGELNRAMGLYKVLEKADNVSGALFLNMGIVSAQQDSLGLAKYYFLKAADFEETEDRAYAALEYVNNQFSRQSATLPKLPWDRATEWMIAAPGAYGVFIAGFIIICVGLIFLYLRWLKILQINKIQWVITFCLITGSIIVMLSFYVDYVDQRYDEAVLVANSERVLQSPDDEQGNLVSIAYEGYSVIVDQWKSAEQLNWLYIRLGNGQYGWIQQDDIKIL